MRHNYDEKSPGVEAGASHHIYHKVSKPPSWTFVKGIGGRLLQYWVL
jgi:hypothetical protein